MAKWGSLWFHKMASQKQMVSKMSGNPSEVMFQVHVNCISWQPTKVRLVAASSYTAREMDIL
jgi:hypothetical protein